MALIIPGAARHSQSLSLLLLMGGMAAVAGVNIRNFPPEVAPSSVNISSVSNDGCAGVVCPYHSFCSPPQQPAPANKLAARCICPEACLLNYQPVCGTDGHTYSNVCLMKVDACARKMDVNVASNGPCPTPATGVLPHCLDAHGNLIADGKEFNPAEDPCETCHCQQGDAVMCKTVQCSPPACSWVPVRGECCKFDCINGTDVSLTPPSPLDPTSLGVRMIATAVTSLLIFALLIFMIHRLRQRRLLINSRRGMNGDRHNPDDFATYMTNIDHVDIGPEFPSYEDPPPPYTPRKPSNQSDEAPPPYEPTNNNAAPQNSSSNGVAAAHRGSANDATEHDSATANQRGVTITGCGTNGRGDSARIGEMRLREGLLTQEGGEGRSREPERGGLRAGTGSRGQLTQTDVGHAKRNLVPIQARPDHSRESDQEGMNEVEVESEHATSSRRMGYGGGWVGRGASKGERLRERVGTMENNIYRGSFNNNAARVVSHTEPVISARVRNDDLESDLIASPPDDCSANVNANETVPFLLSESSAGSRQNANHRLGAKLTPRPDSRAAIAPNHLKDFEGTSHLKDETETRRTVGPVCMPDCSRDDNGAMSTRDCAVGLVDQHVFVGKPGQRLERNKVQLQKDFNRNYDAFSANGHAASRRPANELRGVYGRGSPAVTPPKFKLSSIESALSLLRGEGKHVAKCGMKEKSARKGHNISLHPLSLRPASDVDVKNGNGSMECNGDADWLDNALVKCYSDANWPENSELGRQPVIGQ